MMILFRNGFMRVAVALGVIVWGMGLIGPSGASAATFLGPSPYLCFDSSAITGCGAAQSPFVGTDFSGGYFFLEDFEDGAVNTLGVSASTGSPTTAGGFLTDSVDEDDGAIDGSGTLGRSWFGGGAAGFEFTFDAIALGMLPTHAGIVWTDGAIVNEVTFEAFDATNTSLGLIVAGSIGDSSFLGGTAEDRFFGIVNAGGISKIKIFNSMMSGGGSGIEVDHLQYGKGVVVASIPLPATIWMFLTGLGGLGLFGWRRKRAMA